MLGCGNAYSDYSSGRDLYDGPQWDWLLAGSYYNYAVLEPVMRENTRFHK